MRISKKAEYGLRALSAIARHAGPRPNGRRAWRIEELSARENIPIKFLEQILLTLRRAGFLTSKRGVGGGYALARPPSEISVGEVIRALDGPLAPVPCAAEHPTEPCTCPDPRNCALRALMVNLRRDLSAILDRQTIEDMLHLAPGAETMAFDI